MRESLLIVWFCIAVMLSGNAQVQRDQLKVITKTPEAVTPGSVPITGSVKRLSVVVTDTFPADSSLYHPLPHLNPVSQGITGTCWAFAATAMLESEVLRIKGEKVKLSEMYFVYHEYLARVEAWVDHRGDVYFEEGSESNAVVRLMKEKGIVPRAVYEGKQYPDGFFDHRALIGDLLQMLSETKKQQAWNKSLVLGNAKAILHQHMGTPPDTFLFAGNSYTPQTFLQYLAIIPGDYFSFMSTMSQPWHQKGELVEADNWWHNDDYYNLPPDEFVQVVSEAVQKGYTVCICGDVSEPGLDARRETGIIPTFDIPWDFIDASAREIRFTNGSTTDDHCMHVVGCYKDKNNHWWFLLKDSGAGGFEGKHLGYRFIREDYVKLKMMNLLLHKYGASTVLDHIIK